MEGAPSRTRTRWTGFALGFGVSLAVALPMALGAVSWGEGRVYDVLLRMRRDVPSPLVQLVCLDEATFKALGRDPSRAEIGRAIANLWKKGPTLIAVDLFFREAKGEPEDAALEEALAEAQVVLACSPNLDLMPIPRFSDQAVGLGSVDFLVDGDGILRTVPAPYVEPKEGGGFQLRNLPLALECARLIWFPAAPPEVRLEGKTYYFGRHAYPTDGVAWRIPFCGGDGTLPRISLNDAIAGGTALPDLRGKIVLMGSTRPSVHDFYSVPLPWKGAGRYGKEVASNTMPGVEIHGQALSALLQGKSIVPLPAAWKWTLFGLLSALGTALVVLQMRPLPSALLWMALLGLLTASAILAMRAGVALPALALAITLCAFLAASFGYHRYLDHRERRAVEVLFSRYVSPNIAKKLLKNPELVQLGGRRKVLSILFSDVRGFTTLSEQIPPEQVSGLLNDYFTEMTRILFQFDGTLDKFIGDAILAFFGDPVEQLDHPARALLCAVSMQEEAARLRDRFRAQGKPELHIGVAVTTGPVVVGNNGAKDNFVYTVIGDTVNLASRLQGLAQRDDVILPRATAERIPDFRKDYRFEELEPVKVKGKVEAIEILRVTGRT